MYKPLGELTTASKVDSISRAADDKRLTLGALALEARADALPTFREANPNEPLLAPREITEEERQRQALRDVFVQQVEERNANAWTHDTEMHTTSGALVNQAARIREGNKRLFSDLATAPSTVMGAWREAAIPERAKDIAARQGYYEQGSQALAAQQQDLYARFSRGEMSGQEYRNGANEIDLRMATMERYKPSEDDLAYMQGPEPKADSTWVDDMRRPIPPQELIDSAQGHYDTAMDLQSKIEGDALGKDRSNTLLQPALQKDFKEATGRITPYFDAAGEAWDKGNELEAAGKFLDGIVTGIAEAPDIVLDNQQAVGDFLAEQIPQIATGMIRGIGTKLLGLTNFSYGLDIYKEAVTEYQDKYGRLPTGDDRRQMMLSSLSAVVPEHIADLSILKGAGKIGEAVSDAAEGASAVEKASGSLVRIAKETGTNTAKEAVTEGYQAYVEENLSRLESGVDVEAVYSGMVLGGAMGSTFSGGGQTVAEAAQALGAAAQRSQKVTAEKKAEVASRLDTFTRAYESGDVTELTKTAPGDAAGALVRRVLEKEDLTEETKTEHREQVKSIITNLNTRVANQEGMLDKAKLTKDIESLDAEIASPDTSEADKTRAQQIKAIYTADLEQLADEKFVAKETVILENLKKQQTLAVEAERLLVNQEKLKDEDIESLVSQVNSVTPSPERDQAVEKTVTLLMSDPEFGTAERINSLVSNLDNGFTTEQRDTLRKVSDARKKLTELKKTKEVSEDVFTGKKEFKGLSTYESNATAAILRGDFKQMQREIQQLQKFLLSHKRKAAGLTQAINSIRNKGEGAFMYLVSDTATLGGWRLTETKPKGFTQKDNQGFVVENTPKGINGAKKTQRNVVAESQAIEAMYGQLQAMYDLRFKNEAANDQTTAQQPEAGSQPAQATVEESVPLSEYEQDASQATPQDGVRDVEVEAPNLTQGKPNVREEPAVRSTISPKQAEGLSDDALNRAIEVLQDKGPIDKLSPTDAATFTVLDTEMTRREDAVVDTETAAGDTQADLRSTATTQTSEQAPVERDATTVERVDETSEVIQEADPESNLDAEPVPEAEGLLPGFADAPKESLGNVSAADLKNPETNLLTGWFQQGGRPTKTSNGLPLVTLKNFLSAWTKDLTLPLMFIGDSKIEKLSPEQEGLMAVFGNFTLKWGRFVSGNIAHAKKAYEAQKGDKAHIYRAQNLLSYLDEVPQNLVTGVALSAFTWAIENAGGDGYNTPDKIRKIAGLGKEQRLTPKVANALYDAGDRKAIVIQNLGKRVAQSLALKAKKGSPVNAQTQLELALGTQALAILLQAGYVQEIDVEGVFSKDTDGEQDGIEVIETAPEKESKEPFIRIVRDAKRLPHKDITDMIKASKNTGSILSKVFGFDPNVTGPSLEPGEFNQKTIKGTDRAIPSVSSRVQKKVSERAHKVRGYMIKTLRAFDPKIYQTILGAIDPEDVWVHVDDEKSQLAKNSAIARDYDHLVDLVEQLEWLEGGLTTEMYFPPQVWLPQRTGIASNTVNMQSSKIHRQHLNMAAWEIEIDPATDVDTMTEFFLAVGQALGVKVDKLQPERSMEGLKAKLNNEVIAKGIEVLKKLDKAPEGTKLSIADQNTVAAAVAEANAGERPHALNGLMNWARFENAENKSFTTDITYEVDGVTNGPAIAHLMLGQMHRELGEKTGFYTQDSPFNELAEWKTNPTAQDLYESAMGDAAVVMRASSQTNPLYQVFSKFTGDLVDLTNRATSDGRNLMKPAVTPVAFGASVKKTVENVADAFLEMLVLKITDVARNRDPGMTQAMRVAEMQDLVREWNKLLPNNMALPIPISTEQARLLSMTPQQQAIVKKVFIQSMGKDIEKAMESRFGDFMRAREGMNTAAQDVFTIFDTVYQHARQTLLNQKMDSGEIEFTFRTKEGTGEQERYPTQDLTQEDEAKIMDSLKSVLPIVHTAMSKASNELDAGMNMHKVAQELAKEEEAAYRNRTSFPDKMPLNRPAIPGKQKASVTAIQSGGLHRYLAGPGVRMMVLLTHAVDSAIAVFTYGKYEALNNHDGIDFSLKDSVEGAKRLNEQTFAVMANYSIPLELLASYDRVLAGIPQLLTLYPDLNMDLARLTAARDAFAILALDAEINKLQFMGSLKSVSQYAKAGSPYTVTDADRKVANDKAAELIKQREALRPKEQAPTPKAEAVTATQSPWGQVGEPTVASDPSLVSFFEENPEATAKQVIAMLEKKLSVSGDKSRFGQFQLLLLKQLKQTVNLDMPVRYITPETEAREESAEFAEGRGGYNPKHGYIGIKSPAFTKSGITPELLLHELTHGALEQAIRTNPDSPAVKELDALLAAARKEVKANGLDKYSNAVASVQELVAWGMTNPGFQREVLAKIQMPTQAGSNKFYSGMKAFIQTAVKILFRGSDKAAKQIAENGMSVLIANTGLLFGQANEQVNQDSQGDTLLMADPDPDTFTTAQTYEALGKGPNPITDSTYDQHLRDILGTVVDSVYGPFGAVPAFAKRKATVTAMDTMLNAMQSGELPFVSAALSHLKLNNQEAFVLESVEVTMREAMKGSQVTREEMRRLFTEARKQLSDDGRDFYKGNWATANQGEKDKAQSIYDFVFKHIQNTDGTSDYLSRFAAVGLAYKPLHDALASKVTTTKDTLGNNATLLDKLSWAFHQAMRWLAQKMVGVKDWQTADQSLKAMVENLARIEARKKQALQRRNDTTDSGIAGSLEKLGKDAWKKAGEFADKMLDKGYKNAIAKLAAASASIAANDRLELVTDAIQKMRDQAWKERLGFMGELINEIRGAKDDNLAFYKLLRMAKKHEQDRKFVIDQHALNVKKAFLELSKDESEALTRLLKTDMASLIADYSLEEIQGFLNNPAALDQAITQVEQKLTGQHRGYYLDSTRALGYSLAVGKFTLGGVMQNAHAIAFLAGTKLAPTMKQGQNQQDAIAAEEIIDSLASLYALKYLPTQHKTEANQVFARELNRAEGNGIEFMLKLHQKLKQDSLKTLFENNPMLMRKGWIKEMFNHHNRLVVANEAEGKLFEQAGYGQGMRLQKDHADRETPTQHLYLIRDGGLDARVTGIVSYTGKRAAGSTVHAGLTAVSFDGTFDYNSKAYQRMRVEKQTGLDDRLISNGTFDPEKATSTNNLVPTLNPAGEIADWRYLMADDTKDDLMEREMRLDQVMGAMAGNIFDKHGAEEMNKLSVEAMFIQYKADLGLKGEAYIDFSENSTDPEIRETYRLLPEETKSHIRKTWGQNGMMVRNDLYNMTFGYRKASAANIFQTPFDDRAVASQVVTRVLAWVLNPRLNVEDMDDRQVARELNAMLRLKKGEDMVQEVVKMVKDNWVIKSIFTLSGNIQSNTWALWAYGVSPQDIVKHHVVAIKGLMAYRRDHKRLFELQQLLDLELAQNPNEVRQEIIELQDAMKRNPVAELVDAGMFSVIVEDIAQEEDPYSYKSKLTREIEARTEWVPGWAKTGAKWALMTQDTPLYKVLNNTTTMSDFVARYTLHQHMTTRKRKPLSREDSLQLISDAFVNYDIPTHQKLQYANDMGLLFFTKYYIRIQKVLFYLWREDPARMLGMATLNNYFPEIQSILDSGFWEKFGWPVDGSVLEYPGSVGEIATVKALLSPFN